MTHRNGRHDGRRALGYWDDGPYRQIRRCLLYCPNPIYKVDQVNDPSPAVRKIASHLLDDYPRPGSTPSHLGRLDTPAIGKAAAVR